MWKLLLIPYPTVDNVDTLTFEENSFMCKSLKCLWEGKLLSLWFLWVKSQVINCYTCLFQWVWVVQDSF